MSTNPTLERPFLNKDLNCYLLANPTKIELPVDSSLEITLYDAVLYRYQLPLGILNIVELSLYLPAQSRSGFIDSKRITMIKAALAWHKIFLLQHSTDAKSHHVLSFDIKLYDQDDISETTDLRSIQNQQMHAFEHSFGARYFMEDLVVDMSEDVQHLQVFSIQDWYALLSAVQTPCELWRFLDYHLAYMQRSALDDVIDFDSERQVLDNFMSDDILFTKAITIDNALINYDMQDKPNTMLITMKLAQRSKNKTTPMYQRHMQQASTLWSQLITQMMTIIDAKPLADKRGYRQEPRAIQWQRQLLDESLFSRHELIRTLYRYHKQSHALKQSGYVVHQHSYEHLGRHYVMIFYGKVENAQQSRAVIKPKLGDIAQEVATRLPLAELNHVIVMGVDFISDNEDTYLDIDLWIQPIDATTQKERQLTKQIQKLKPQASEHVDDSDSRKQAIDDQVDKEHLSDQTQVSDDKSAQPMQQDKFKKLPSMQLKLSIAARKNKP